MNHDAHVIALKEDLYSFISDVSKDAQGFRHRLDIAEYTVAQLEELCDHFIAASEREQAREEESYRVRIGEFEATIATSIECGAGDRETAVRWIREAHADDAWCDLDECIRYALGLPWDYDLDHGDRDFFKRQAAKAA